MKTVDLNAEIEQVVSDFKKTYSYGEEVVQDLHAGLTALKYLLIHSEHIAGDLNAFVLGYIHALERGRRNGQVRLTN